MSDESSSIQNAARDQFSRQSHRYARGHILENIEDVQAALALIRLPEAARVLDVATGAGYTGLHLASLGHRVTLSDLTPAMLDRAREAAARRGLIVETKEHPAETLPYPDGSFDLVTCRVAAHHFRSPEAFVRESARVLAPDGHALLIDGSVEDDQPEAEAWLHEVEKLRDPSHHRLLTPGEWTALFRQAECAIVHCELQPMKQPDLHWYFETAGTTPENRQKVLDLVASAPATARRLFRLTNEDGRIVWWWQRLTLIARRNGP